MQDVRVLNWSQPSTGWWEYSKIFKRVDLDALDIRCLIIEVNPWTFTTYSQHPITKKRSKYRRETENWGNTEDILATTRLADGMELAYRMYLPRRSLLNWIGTVRLQLRKSEALALEPPWYHSDMEAEAKQRDNPDFFPENISRCHMLDYKFSNNRTKRFEQFLQDISDQGHEVILVHPPVVAEYYEYVNSDEKRRREFEKHKKFLDDLSSKYVFVNWQIPMDAELTDDIFVDYGHFSFSGASLYSQLLARTLGKNIEQAVARDGL